MRNIWVIALSLAIIGGVVLFELWTAGQFPPADLELGPLPSLPIGVERKYDYFKDDERVGSYVFWVESKGLPGGKAVYRTRSKTSVAQGGKTIELETIYTFLDDLTPVEYKLNASIGDEHQYIRCLFEGGRVNATFFTEDSKIEKPLELPEQVVLLDYLMLGHWDLLFKSFKFVSGKTYTVNAYTPQNLQCKSIELITDREPKIIDIEGVKYECSVVRVPNLNLVFYIYKGDIVELVNTEQLITISMSR